jgi:hypothetical protein
MEFSVCFAPFVQKVTRVVVIYHDTQSRSMPDLDSSGRLTNPKNTRPVSLVVAPGNATLRTSAPRTIRQPIKNGLLPGYRYSDEIRGLDYKEATGVPVLFYVCAMP